MPFCMKRPSLIALSTLMLPLVGQANTISLSLEEWQTALEQNQSISQTAVVAFQTALDQADLDWQNGQLIKTDHQQNISLSSGCSNSRLNYLDSIITLNNTSDINFKLETLSDPISINLNLNFDYYAAGEAVQNIGIGGGSACFRIGRDTFSVSADGQLNATVTLDLNLNPVINDNQVVFTPRLTLSGQIEASKPVVDVDNTVLSGPLRTYLHDQFERQLNNLEFESILTSLQQDLQNSLNQSLGNEPISLTLPDVMDERAQGIRDLLSGQSGFPLSADFLQEHRLEIVEAMLLGQQNDLQYLVEGAAACAASDVLKASMSKPTLYQQIDNQCVSVDPESASGDTFLDQNCQQLAINYQPTSTNAFCQYALNGDVGSPSDRGDHWTLSPGTQLDLGVESLAGKLQPLTYSTVYKTINNDRGICELEMRVYTDSPNTQGKKALLAFHGGSWKYRRTGALGLEASAAHYVEDNFVMFVPFYRLTEGGEAPQACTGAVMEDILEDSLDAVAWVKDHAANYGVDNPNMAAMGQSAGGFIAAYLGLEHHDLIDKSLVLYAPVDFQNYLLQSREGSLGRAPADNIISSILGRDTTEIGLNDPDVVAYSLPQRMMSLGAQPKFHVYLGDLDELLPEPQGSRYCAAAANQTDYSLTNLTPILESEVQQSWQCGEQSQYFFYPEAKHAMDLCLPGVICNAGSEESMKALAEQMAISRKWLAQDEASQLIEQSNVEATE